MSAATEVYVSDLLAGRYPKLHAELKTKLALHGVALQEIPGTRDI